jgi:hypothetical protein
VDEFGSAQADGAMYKKAVTTLNRTASRLARWHDVLFFRGSREGEQLRPPDIIMPPVQPPPRSLREAATDAEAQIPSNPIPVPAPLNEGLVGAVYAAVLELEDRGYYSTYHLVLGQELWRALHEPSNALVLPRERIEPTLMGGAFHRTTTLPDNEALLASLDGPTFDCVTAGDPMQQPLFEFLRIAPAQADQEEIFLFRVVERFAPRVRENRAIIRLVTA